MNVSVSDCVVWDMCAHVCDAVMPFSIRAYELVHSKERYRIFPEDHLSRSAFHIRINQKKRSYHLMFIFTFISC